MAFTSEYWNILEITIFSAFFDCKIWEKLIQTEFSFSGGRDVGVVACQTPLSMGFSRRACWSGLPCPLPGDLPDPGIKPMSFMSPALATELFTTSAPWEHQHILSTWYTPGFPVSLAGKEFTCNAGDPSSIPGSGRSAGEGIGYPVQYSWASLVKNLPARCETWIWSLGWKDPLETGKAPHSSILAWRIPYTE